jgi:hypothetical protein
VLIGAETGLFRFDPAAGRVVPAGGAAAGSVLAMHDLPGGAVLIGAVGSAADAPIHRLGRWFRFDPAAGRVVPAGEVATGRVSDMHDLPGSAVLIGAEKGVFMSPARALAEADLRSATDFHRLTPNSNWQEVRFIFSHPCAPVSGDLGLTLGGESVRQLRNASLSQDSAALATSLVFDRPGNWSLQLRQGPTLIGQPLQFTLRTETLWERLVSAWQIVLVVAAVLYLTLFGTLLLLTRRYA